MTERREDNPDATESYPVEYSTVSIRDEAHLFGGMRAAAHVSGCLILYPSGMNSCIAFPSKKDRREFGQVLYSVGLRAIGLEGVYDNNGVERSNWRLFEVNREDAADYWTGIAHSAHLSGNRDIAELARKITFSLRASSLRLRDISREYFHQNLESVSSDARVGKRFSNVRVFDLYMALHSALVEMCSLRDYLAHFISAHILSEKLEASRMSRLFRALKSYSGTDALINEVRQICDPDSADGWMARLGRYRDLVVHQAPIKNFSENPFLTAKSVRIGDRDLYYVYLGIPSDPITSLNDKYEDALEICFHLMRRLFSFANRVAIASGIEPQRFKITDDMIRG